MLRYSESRLYVFQIQRDTGVWESVEYSSFAVGPESDKYRLSVSGFSGDTGDALAAPAHSASTGNGMKFTAPGQDNDNDPNGQCANGTKGWWFNYCSRSSLNSWQATVWNAYTTEMSSNVVFSRIMVKLD